MQTAKKTSESGQAVTRTEFTVHGEAYYIGNPAIIATMLQELFEQTEISPVDLASCLRSISDHVVDNMAHSTDGKVALARSLQLIRHIEFMFQELIS